MKKLIHKDKVSCRSSWSASNKWFKFAFFDGYFPSKEDKPFVTICIPSAENNRTAAIQDAVKSRLKHAGFDIAHYSITFEPPSD